MNTKNLGLIAPTLFKEFGQDSNIDFFVSLSHSLVAQKIEGAKVSGFSLEKNGNFRFTINFSVVILVEDAEGNYKEARSLYCGLAAKGKAAVVEKSWGDKVLQIQPRGGEVSTLKIFDAEDKEMVAEEMMFTTALNLQLEKLVKFVPPKEFRLKKNAPPKELECLGFTVGDSDIRFKKGFVEMLIPYKLVEHPSDPEICEKFLAYIRSGPQEIVRSYAEVLGVDGDNLKMDTDSMTERLHAKLSDLSQRYQKYRRHLDEPSEVTADHAEKNTSEHTQ